MEWAPRISTDGLTLCFSSWHRPDPAAIYVATRQRTSDPFGGVRRLLTPVNGLGDSEDASLSADGRRLYFDSNRELEVRPGRERRKHHPSDIFVAIRDDITSPFDRVERLDPGVNTPANEMGASIGGAGRALFFNDSLVHRDDSPRCGIRLAVRPARGAAFREAVRLPAPVNSAAYFAFEPWGSRDWPAPDSELYFSRGEDGFLSDLYVATWHPDGNGNRVDDRDDLGCERPPEDCT